jgi:hypothetical protein
MFEMILMNTPSSSEGNCLGTLIYSLKLGSMAFIVFLEKNTLGLNLMLIVAGAPSLDTSCGLENSSLTSIPLDVKEPIFILTGGAAFLDFDFSSLRRLLPHSILSSF